MYRIFNRFPQRENRKQLRKAPVPAEAILWSRLKRKQQRGIRFRRQYSIGRYVVDFYCPSARLVIELDGNSHTGEPAQEYDKIRDEYIGELGLRVLRFKNEDIYRNLTGVIETIIDQAS